MKKDALLEVVSGVGDFSRSLELMKVYRDKGMIWRFRNLNLQAGMAALSFLPVRRELVNLTRTEKDPSIGRISFDMELCARTFRDKTPQLKKAVDLLVGFLDTSFIFYKDAVIYPLDDVNNLFVNQIAEHVPDNREPLEWHFEGNVLDIFWGVT